MLKPLPRSGRDHRLGSSLREVSLLWQAELFANSSLTGVPNHADVQQAASRIRPFVRKTPMLQLEIEGRPVWVKLENTQATGSFKLRGAFNSLLTLSPQPRSVVAASGGNHGLGVAEAARQLEIEAHIFVPTTAPVEKVRLLELTGAHVTRQGSHYLEAEEAAMSEAQRLGVPFLHPFCQPAVIAGAGTVGLEILEQTHGNCDAVIVAVGGGGLLSGVAIALGGSGIRVLGVEPEGIPTVHRALREGRPVEVPVESITRSALGAARTTEMNLAIIQRLSEGVVLVPDEAILAAQAQLWDLARQWVEPAAATTLAALSRGVVDAREPCIVLCGGNAAAAGLNPRQLDQMGE